MHSTSISFYYDRTRNKYHFTKEVGVQEANKFLLQARKIT